MTYKPTWRVIAVCDQGIEETVYVGSDYNLAQSRREKALTSPLGYVSVRLTTSHTLKPDPLGG